MRSATYPQWKGFEFAPQGCLLEQRIDLSEQMGIAYERCVEFYKDFHTHERLMFVFPRGASSMEVRSVNPREAFRVDGNSILIVPQRVEHDDEGTSAIYDTFALYPDDILLRYVGTELGIPPHETDTVHERCRKLRRTAWMKQLLQEYFFERVLASRSAGERTRFLEREIVREVFRQLFKLREVSQVSFLESEPDTAAKALRFIESNLFASLSMEQICKSIGASESDLLRKFKAAAETTPYSYIKNRRLEEARKLLESSDHPVGTIALLVGYGNFGAFTEAYRAKFGTVPSRSRPRKL